MMKKLEKKTEKNFSNATIGRRTRPEVSTSGFPNSH
jgi:hypothetical protein